MNFKLKIPSISLELAEETGWHIGDGTMNFYLNQKKLRGMYQLRGHRVNDKNHYTQRVKPFFYELFDLNISLRDMPSTGVFGFQIWNDNLINFKKELGLPLGKKTDIKVPNIFFKNKELLSSVIRGIFDTDGCIYLENKNEKRYPRVEIKTISASLAHQLKKAFIGLNLRATMYANTPDKNHLNAKPSFTVAIRGENMLHEFMKKIGPENENHLKKYETYNNLYK